MNNKSKKPANENLGKDDVVFSKPVDLSKKIMFIENGGINEDLLDDIDGAFHKEFEENFYNGLKDDLKSIDQSFEAMKNEKNMDKRKKIAEELFNIVHRLRGQGGSFGYELISVVSNNVCRFLEDNKTLDDTQLSAIRLCLDTLKVVIANDIKGSGGEKGQAIIDGLDAVEEKLLDHKSNSSDFKIEDIF